MTLYDDIVVDPKGRYAGICDGLVPVSALPKGTRVLKSKTYEQIHRALSERGLLKTVEDEGNRLVDAFMVYVFCKGTDLDDAMRFLEMYDFGGRGFMRLLQIAYLRDPGILERAVACCDRFGYGNARNTVLWAIYFILSESASPDTLERIRKKTPLGKVLKEKLPSGRDSGIGPLDGYSDRPGTVLYTTVRNRMMYVKIRACGSVNELLNAYQTFEANGFKPRSAMKSELVKFASALMDTVAETPDIDGFLKEVDACREVEGIAKTSMDLDSKAYRTVFNHFMDADTPKDLSRRYVNVHGGPVTDVTGITRNTVKRILVETVTEKVSKCDDDSLKSGYYNVVPQDFGYLDELKVPLAVLKRLAMEENK